MDGSEQDEQPSVHPFAPARTPGAQLDFTMEYSPLELFQLTFSQSVVQTLCTNTNKKAQRRIDQGMKTPWSPLEPGELYRYFGVLISMGLVRCPETRDYWSRARCYSLPFPRTVFSRTRFEAISWALHISDPDTDGQNDALRGTDRYDRLFRLRPLIDEKSPTGKGLSHDDVIDLLTPYLGTGYQVYVDNWYTSTALFQELHGMRFGACGTCRENRKGYPVTKVNDMPRNAERVSVREYNKFMGGVDLSDALLKYYSIRRKTMKRYKALLFHFIDVAVVNGFLLHKELAAQKQRRPLTHKRFWEFSRASLHLVLFPVPPGLLLVVVLWVQLVDLVASQSLSVTLAQWIAPARRQQAGGDVFIALLMVSII
ncbi:hypothetical protein SKAU_G00422880 [Synaphobranchus kaupii]|uniref:PiggyBac transposable element-derived protein domain-containing protein n=1 Tax=Synaphobranchus kaupii TaxID=118154 RepID=A0A9Q1E5A4_SYNKA|nr:hypothetical protein SKAU_G00422880 [Synaphobranchus kaupii]